MVKVLERLGAELDRAKADKSYRIAVACGNRSKQVRWVQDLTTERDMLWSLRQYHGHSGADVKDYDFRQAVGFDVIGVGAKRERGTAEHSRPRSSSATTRRWRR